MLVVASLGWNGGDGLIKPSTSFNKDIVAGNRAAAWFELRYGSNGGDAPSAGVAKRRYFESQTFGLWDSPSGPASVTEALQAYNVLTHNRQAIFAYEKLWGDSPDGSPDGSHVAKPALDAAAGDYASLIGGSVGLAAPQRLVDLFTPAEAMLFSQIQTQFAGSAEILSVLNANAFDPRRHGQRHDLCRRGPNHRRTWADLGHLGHRQQLCRRRLGQREIWGSGGNDTLIGGSGNVTIYGGAGNELIRGGSGDDSINGGSGHDTINAGGDGSDTIFAGDGDTTKMPSGVRVRLCGKRHGHSAVALNRGLDFNVSYIRSSQLTLALRLSSDTAKACDAAAKLGNLLHRRYQSASGYPNSNDYEGVDAAFDRMPVGLGNDTVYGGRGRQRHLLSNGDNYVDAGGCNDSILGRTPAAGQGLVAENSLLKGLSSNWHVFTTSVDVPEKNSSWNDGYFGVTYLNKATGEVVIANRGTDLPDAPLSNVLTDLSLFLGEAVPVQDDAAAFATAVVKSLGQQGLPTSNIIETGHSLGGSEAQAALASLVDSQTLTNAQISGVVFNAPGVGGFALSNPASSYNVVTLYTQGDAIHTAGGVHLGGDGNAVMLPAGPDTSALSVLAPAAVSAGPLGIVALLGMAIYDVLGPAHSIATVLRYLAAPAGSQIGTYNWTSVSSASALSGSVVNTTLPSLSVDASGDLVITDHAANVTTTVSVSADKQSLKATFSGGSSALAASLGSLGVVSIPIAQLTHDLTALTNAPTLYETIARNPSGAFDVAFATTPGATSPTVADQFSISALNPNAAFNYALPPADKALVETIDNGAGNTAGSISVLSGSSSTQLLGGNVVAGQIDTWTDASGEHYTFTPSGPGAEQGDLTITDLAGSTNAANEIIIQNFDLLQAESSAGDLGIRLQNRIEVGFGSSTPEQMFAGDPLTQVSLGANGEQTFMADFALPTIEGQWLSVQLSGDSGDNFALSTGSTLVHFINGQAQIALPAGTDSVPLALVNLTDPGQSEQLQLSFALTSPDGSSAQAADNALTLTYTADAPATPPDTLVVGETEGSSPVTYYTGTGQTSNDLVLTDSGPNQIRVYDGNDSIAAGSGNDTIVSGNGNSTIAGGGGQDEFLVGDGDNAVYANGALGLTEAIDAGRTGTATGQQGSLIATGSGNNTVVGGNGNDLIMAGQGNNVIVGGPGNETIFGGVVVTGELRVWSATTDGAYSVETPGLDTGNPGDLPLSGRYEGNLWGIVYDENAQAYVQPRVGLGNETIYGGKGDSVIFLSNGDDYVDAGGGNDSISGGMGRDTIFGGSGNVTVEGGGGDTYIDGESGNDYLVGQEGNNTIHGGTGNDTIFAGEDQITAAPGQTWDTSATGNNYVDGGSGNAEIWGSGGNDTLIGGSGNVTIYGGAGNELIRGGSGNDSINGGSGHDTIFAGGDGTDTIFAGSGDTTIHGGGGTDYIQGGAGNNLLDAGDGGVAGAATTVRAGSGDTTIQGGLGIDVLIGGDEGNDVIDAGDGGTADQRTLVQAGSGNTTIYGGAGIDQLQGGDGSDVIYAGDGGTDAAATYVLAGSGDTTIYGGAGTQFLQAGWGRTTIVAGTGNETLLGGTGATTFVIGADAGNIVISNNYSPYSADIIDFGNAVDPDDVSLTPEIDANGKTVLVVEGDANITVLSGAATALNLQFQANATAFGTYAVDSAGNTVTTRLNAASTASSDVWTQVDGSNGTDAFAEDGSSSGTSHLADGTSTQYTDDGKGDRVSQLFDSQGNLAADFLTAADGTSGITSENSEVEVDGDSVQASISFTLPEPYTNLTMVGNADVIAIGNNLDDSITGNAGNDLLQAGDDGSTTLVSGTGIDTLVGGHGQDTFIVNNAADVIQSKPGYGGTVFSSVSYVMPANVSALTLTGSADLQAIGSTTYGVTLTGNAGNDTLSAGAGGNTTLIAGSGLATLVGGAAGDDTFVVNNALDVIEAQAGASNHVRTSVSYSAADHIGSVSATGSADVALVGSKDTSSITGNNGNDTIDATARTGHITLTGGSGKNDFILGSSFDAVISNTVISNNVISNTAGGGTLTFGAGISEKSLTVNITDGYSGSPSVVLTENGSSVSIKNALDGAIGTYIFADGTSSTLDQLLSTVATRLSATDGKQGNFILGTGGNVSLAGGSGQDTLAAYGDNDTLVAGAGGDLLEAHGDDAVLVGGAGSDTLRGGSGVTTFIVGTGASTVVGGSGGDVYDLTAGAFTTLRSTTANGTETVWLPSGAKLSDFSTSRVNSDLVLQSSVDATTAVVSDYFSDTAQAQRWVIASENDNPKFLNDVVRSQTVSSSDGYENAVVAAERIFSTNLSANRAGLAGKYLTAAYPEAESQEGNGFYYNYYGVGGMLGSMLYDNPTGPSNFTFSGLTTLEINLHGGTYQTQPAETDAAEMNMTTTTVTESEPVYETRATSQVIRIIGATAIAEFLGTADQTSHIVPIPTGFVAETQEDSSGQTIEIDLTSNAVWQKIQTGVKWESTTSEEYTTSTRSSFTIEHITTDDSDTQIEGSPAFGGTIDLGNGNDWVDLPDASPPLASPDGVAPALGAFIRAGDGNDTLHAGYGMNVFAAGAGFDEISGGGLTSVNQQYGGPVDESVGYPDEVYVPMSGYATEIITISNVQFGADAPSNKLVLPDGLTASDLTYRVINDAGSESETVQLSYGNSNVLINYGQVYVPGPSADLNEEEDSEANSWTPYYVVTGIQEFIFSDGSTKSLADVMAEATPLGADTAPVVEAPAGGLNLQTSQTLNVSDFIGSSVKSGVALWYKIRSDSRDDYFELNGVRQTGYFMVSAAELPGLSYVTGSASATDQISISAFDGALWSDQVNFALNVADSAPHPTSESYTAASGILNIVGTGTADVTLTGNEQNNSIHGNDGNDTLIGGAGSDTLTGGSGNDLLLGDSGPSGVVTVRAHATLADGVGANMQLWVNGALMGSVEVDSTTYKDYQFALASPINAGAKVDLVYTNDAVINGQDRNLFVKSITVGDQIIASNDPGVTLDKGSGNDAFDGVRTIAGQNGLLWNGALRFTVPASPAEGAAAGDILTGGAGDDTLVGGAENDTLIGGTGANVYVFGKASGNDLIANDGNGTLDDSIQLSPGVAPTEVSARRAGDDLVLGIANTNDSLTVQSYFAGGTDQAAFPIGGVGFADGTQWTNDDIHAKTLIGTSAAEALTGYATDDALIGGGGNDTLDGGDGNDTLFAGVTSSNAVTVQAHATLANGVGADMQLWVNGAMVGAVEVDSSTYEDYQFVLPSPITAGAQVDVVYTNDGVVNGQDRNLFVKSITVGHQTIASTDPSVTLDKGSGAGAFDGANTLPGQGAMSWNGALRLTLPASGSLTGDNALIGGNGNDSLFGGAGNDTYVGGAGDDQLTDVSSTSNDVDQWGRGDGHDTISDAGGNSDRLEVAAGTTADQLWFRRTGSDLDISLLGSNDDVLIKNWYVGTGHQIESIVLAGGQTLLAPDVQKLVDAMASFSPPAAGQSQLTSHESSVLQPVLAANWH